MNFRQLLRLCTFGSALLLNASLSSRASAVITPIPAAIKTSPDADKSAPLINAFVKTQVDALASPATRHEAREALIAEVTVPGVSTQFLDTYAKAINDQLQPLVKTSQDQTIRLNAAIID